MPVHGRGLIERVLEVHDDPVADLRLEQRPWEALVVGHHVQRPPRRDLDVRTGRTQVDLDDIRIGVGVLEHIPALDLGEVIGVNDRLLGRGRVRRRGVVPGHRRGLDRGLVVSCFGGGRVVGARRRGGLARNQRDLRGFGRARVLGLTPCQQQKTHDATNSHDPRVHQHHFSP